MFDPYHKWLGIQPDQRPPTLYQLLGISPREQDPEVIDEAAIRQTAHVRTYQNGPHAKECARILNEIARARAILLDPAKRKEYDLRLAKSAPPATPVAAPAAPAAPAAGAFEFAGPPATAPTAEPADEDDAIEPAVPSLARPRSATGSRLGLIVAIVLGGAIPVGAFLVYLAVFRSKSHPVATQPAQANKGGDLAQANPAPQPARANPAVRPDPQPEVNPGPKNDTPEPPDQPGRNRGPSRTRPPDNPDSPIPIPGLPGATTSRTRPPRTGTTSRVVRPRVEPTPPVVQPPPKKLPVPDEAKQAAAEKLIKELYQKDYLAARKPADKQTLAAKLMRQAEETKDDPAARFVLLREASNLAAQAGDLAVALAAVEEIVRGYEADPLPLKVAALTTASKVAVTPGANKDVVEAVLLVVNQALTEDQFDTATKLLTLADVAARKAMSLPLVGQVQARTKEVADLKKEADAAQAAADTLREKPDDPEANLAAGKHLCFRRGKWDKGLPYLARGSDAALQELAKKDLANPKDPPTQVDVGDRWWALAEGQKGTAETILKGRANYWYEKALPGLTGLSQARVEKRVKEYNEKSPTAKAPALAGELRRFTGHTDRVTSVAISADGTRAASGSADGTVRVWDTETGKELRKFTNHQGEVTCVAITADGSRVVSGGKDGRAMLHVVDNGRTSNTFSMSRPIECLTVSPDGSTALFGISTGTIWLWSLEPGGRTSSLPRTGRAGTVYSVAFSPNGRLVMAAGADGIVRLWDPDGYREIGKLTTPLPEVRGLAFSPDGLHVVTGGADRVIRFWDIRNGKEVRPFKGHTQRVTSLALTGDGSRLLSGSDDKTVRLWDVKTGRELHRFPFHTDKVTSVAIPADGRLGISGSDDKTVRLWSLPK